MERLSLLYTVWVLFGVVAFVAHLGDDVREMLLPPHGRDGWDASWLLWLLLPAGGAPRHQMMVASWTGYFAWNLPLAGVFLVQHTGMRRLKNLLSPRGKQDEKNTFRLAYNFLSAVALHLFMSCYAGVRLREESSASARFVLDPFLELRLPMSAAAHFAFAAPVICFSFYVFLTSEEAWTLLTGSRATAAGGTIRSDSASSIDVITLMARTVVREYGSLGFILFSGLSIVPRDIRLDDVVLRVCAAVYLRKFSAHFRQFTREAAAKHHLAWLLRALVVGAAVMLQQSSSLQDRQWLVGYCAALGLGCIGLMLRRW